MTDQEMIVVSVRERLQAQINEHVDPKVMEAIDLLHAAGIIYMPAPDGGNLMNAINDTAKRYKEVRARELLPRALNEVLAKVTFNILTEGHDGKAEKDTA